MTTTSGTRRAKRLVLFVAAVCLLATGFASAAYAGIIAERSATIAVSTGTWSAKASSSSVTFVKRTTGQGQAAVVTQGGIFSVQNTGTLGLSGFSIVFSGTTGVSGQLTVSECRGGTWTSSGNGGNITHSCDGTVVDLATSSGGTASVSTSLAAGSSISLRVSGSSSAKDKDGGTTVSVKVAKRNAVSAR